MSKNLFVAPKVQLAPSVVVTALDHYTRRDGGMPHVVGGLVGYVSPTDGMLHIDESYPGA